MSHGGVLTSSAVIPPLLLLLLLLCASPLGHGAATHNITDILAAHPEFAEFSAALNSTGAATEIDRRSTVTVLAVNNTAMAAARGLRPEDLKRAVDLHVLLDYYDGAKLSSIQGGFVRAATLYQASGNAPGSDGIVNITKAQASRVAFTAPASGDTAPAVTFYEKTVLAKPYDIAVLQVSALISSPPAGVQAPAPAPAPRSNSSQGSPVAAPAHAPAPAPARAPAAAPATPAPAPVRASPAPPATTPAPAPVTAPATAPTPRRRPAPEPASAPAPSPDADDKTPADQKNKGARDTAVSWTLGETVVAAALPAIVWVL